MWLAVKGAWIAENLNRLGSGSFYHLAYPTHQISPALLNNLRTGKLRYGNVEIYVLREHEAYQIADGQLVAVHWYPEFIRIHFMIAKVYVDSMGKHQRWPTPDYLAILH